MNGSDMDMRLSPLAHTWILDLDGTILEHNGYKEIGGDKFLPGAEQFLKSIPAKDMIIFLTARKQKYKQKIEAFLKDNGIRYHHIIFDVPVGERILINDDKPSGLNMSYALRKKRNEKVNIDYEIDETL